MSTSTIGKIDIESLDETFDLNTRKASSMLSKKRYYQIEDMLLTHNPQHVEEILTAIKDIMNFDPLQVQTRPPTSSGRKSSSMMSKKRYYEIVDNIRNHTADARTIDIITDQIMEIMDFDPKQKQYDSLTAIKRSAQLREKALNAGQTINDYKWLQTYNKRKDQLLANQDDSNHITSK